MDRISMLGQQFGKLTVVAHHEGSRWKVQCACGVQFVYRRCHLVTGHKTACGKECMYPDLAGKTIGLWKITERAANPPGKHGKYWKCKCSNCGLETIKSSRMLNQYSGGCVCTHRAPDGRTPLRALIISYKRSAKKRGLLFELTEEQCKSIFSRDCCYCGRKPSQIKR